MTQDGWTPAAPWTSSCSPRPDRRCHDAPPIASAPFLPPRSRRAPHRV